MSQPCHILIEGNSAIIYASRNGTPAKILPVLTRFLEKFWQERDASGESSDTPECLAAQIIVRFGFEMCEDDYSNLRVGTTYSPNVEYLYWIGTDRSVREPEPTVQTWIPSSAYRQNPSLGLAGCRQITQDLTLPASANC